VELRRCGDVKPNRPKPYFLSSTMMLGTGESVGKQSAMSLNRERTKVKLEPASVGRLRKKISSRGVHGMHGLMRLLKVMDDNGDGVLTKEELKYGLEDLGVRLHDVELDEVFAFFDKDKNGAISQNEFLRGVRGALPRYRERIIRRAFEALEKTDDGFVTIEELEVSYNVRAHPDVVTGKLTATEALQEFLRQWEDMESAFEVSYEEFLEYSKNLSAMIESDEDFEELFCRVWRLDWEPKKEENDFPHREAGFESKENDNADNVTGFYTEKPERHPDAPRPGKVTVPKWIRYDCVVLTFLLYHKEITRDHTGQFDPVSRQFDTKEREAYRVRTFVLKYFPQDDEIAIHETTKGHLGSSQFLAKAKLNLGLRDLVVGNKVTIKGLPFHVADADRKAREFFKDELPDVVMPEALPVPKEPLTEEEIRLEKHKLGKAFSAQKKLEERRSLVARNFVENDGKILQFDCIWDDPGLNGERRQFKLFYHLSDGKIEMRERSRRNSGRERQAMLNLKKAHLPNPEREDCPPYEPVDLRIGSTIHAFGREMLIISCDPFTEQFMNDQGYGQVPGASKNTKQLLGRSHPQNVNLGLYTNAADQKYVQVLAAIRSITEQRTKFGTEYDQRRMLNAYLKRFLLHKDDMELTEQGFKHAVAGFSCFGFDADLLVQRMQNKATGGIPMERMEAAVFGNDSTIMNVEAENRLPVEKKLSSKVQGLVRAIREKIEVMTDFSEPEKQRRELVRILNKGCAGMPGILTRDQFRGAMAPLNCWDKDANALFDNMDVHLQGRLKIPDIAIFILSN